MAISVKHDEAYNEWHIVNDDGEVLATFATYEMANQRIAESKLKTITVVMVEEEYPNNPLIYTVQVNDPQDQDEVAEAIETERERDLGMKPNPCTPLFAFAGDLHVLADWRE